MIHKLVFSRRGALLGVLASLAAVGLAIPATAAAKVTSVTSCQTINVSGKYRLDADVSGSGPDSLDCIHIDASNVTLSLNGHSVTSGFPVDFGAIGVLGGSVKILGPGTVTVQDVGEPGIMLLGGNGIVRGVTVTGRGEGIHIDSSYNNVRGNVVNENPADGIVIQSDVSQPTGNTIVGNVVNDNAGGILAGGTRSTIVGNVVNDNGFGGIRVFGTGNTIVGNSATGNGLIDLFDFNGNCTSNVWRGNTFGTANPSCIQ